MSMSCTPGCNNSESVNLIREGTTQDRRVLPALDPGYAPVDGHAVEHRIVFARAYSAYLKFFNMDNATDGDWQAFFGSDRSVLLALAAVQNAESYRQAVKEKLDFLKDVDEHSSIIESKQALGFLFSCTASLARELDALKEGLSETVKLKATLASLIKNRLAPAFNRMISCYKGDVYHVVADIDPEMEILGNRSSTFSDIIGKGLSGDWFKEGTLSWNASLNSVETIQSVYEVQRTSPLVSDQERINHIATHNLFTSILDQFLKGYARIILDARNELKSSYSEQKGHEPHYALFLAFLQLFEYARAGINTITGRHLDLYYRKILGLKEREPEPGRVHLIVELAKHAQSYKVNSGELFRAGKDASGIDAYYAGDRELVVNRGQIAALKTVYWYNYQNPNDPVNGRLYSLDVTDSDDGIKPELNYDDKSWHPFYNENYRSGMFPASDTPAAEVGFAVASHHLLMAGGIRSVTVQFTLYGSAVQIAESMDKIHCRLTGVKGWIDATVTSFSGDGNKLSLALYLTGAEPAVVPFSEKVHGYGFNTLLPVLLVTLRNDGTDEYSYNRFCEIAISEINISVMVSGLRSLAVSNDFGPVDTSSPFQPFGASPKPGSYLTVGSNEVFQKGIQGASIDIVWQGRSSGNYESLLSTETLYGGEWLPEGDEFYVIDFVFPFFTGSGWTAAQTDDQYRKTYAINPLKSVDAPDLSKQDYYSVTATHGYVRLKSNSDFGQADYQTDLLDFLANKTGVNPGAYPAAPVINSIQISYSASQKIAFDSQESSGAGNARYFHVAPFGQAEQNSGQAGSARVNLLPQFMCDETAKRNQSEFYIGIEGLRPPANLALLFQVADGTANPLSEKPDDHINWSYLKNNRWFAFRKSDIEDNTGGLIRSGVITFALPREASDDNTILPTGKHWIRGSVSGSRDAVCRLVMVAAQGLSATFADRGNDPLFGSTVLAPGSVSRLERPDPAVKKIDQPYPSFGGRGRETSARFYTRVSERLRHKDRAVAMWDYEHLVLEAFPQIYRVKCLNHTKYDTDADGNGLLDFAPGHVTVVTIPNAQLHKLNDQLKPYTSLGLLKEIESYLRVRLPGFARLHIKNPVFEEVRVEFNVCLKPGSDESYYKNTLNTAIVRFLSPWAFSGGGNPSFGGGIGKSALIDFVEEQPYVEWVSDFKLIQNGYLRDNASGSTAVSVLVSAREHKITTVNPAMADTMAGRCGCQS